MQKFDFTNVLWVTTPKLCKMTSVARSTLCRITAEYIKAGGDAKDMGRITLKGMNAHRWDPRIFVSWLIKHKLVQPIKFDYELEEQKTLQQILVFNNLPLNKQQIETENTV